MKPPVPYFGGKMGVGPLIADLLPKHLHYVEPFCGSLSVLLAKVPSPHETVNDLDGNLMTFWRVLRDRGDELARACALTPHSRAEYAAARNQFDDIDDLELARRVWVTLTQGRSGTLREAKTGWRHFVKPGPTIGMPGYLENYVDRMQASVARLHNVSLECMPALDLIAKYGGEPDVLLYVDPPYLGTTRGWGNNYRHEMKTDAEHRELAGALQSCQAIVVLSGYPSDLYDRELYAGWDRVTLAATTGNGVDRDRTEVLWSNRPLGHQRALWDGEDLS